MIQSPEEYQRTRQYVERLQDILLSLRQSHETAQYEALSRGYLTELARAQREITAYLAVPAA